MPRVRVRMLRDSMIDGRPVRADSRQILTQEEADFFLLRGYAKPEPLKPRRSKKGKPGYVDTKQKALDKLLAARSVDDSASTSGSAVDSVGEDRRGESEASGLEEASATSATSAEAGESEGEGLPEMPGDVVSGVVSSVSTVHA